MGDVKRGVAIGIDAGGTKTLGILVDSQGREVARAQSGGANPWDVGPEKARKALESVLAPLLAGGNVRAVCLGSAGVDREEDRIAVEASLRELVPQDIAITVRNDAAAALGLSGPKRPAMVVVADTGSIAYGESADSREMRAGGHGAIVGDRGSASGIGMAAIRYVADVLDGLEQRGSLAESLIAHLKLRRAPDVVVRIQHPELDVPLLASLAPLVARAAGSGDQAARNIIEAEGTALAATAKRVARDVRTDAALPALLVGSTFSAFPEIRDKVKAALRQTGPVVILESSECVLGAARLAVELALA